MPTDAYEYMKILLNVNKNAKIVIDCELHANVRFLALMNASIGRQFTQMNAYFLVMNSKRCKHPYICLLYTSPSPRDGLLSRMPSSA